MAGKKREIPRFDQPMIETHCHLDYLQQRDTAETLQRTRAVNVERLITIAVSASNLAKVREIAASFADVYATQGVHPHEADAYDARVETKILAGLDDPKVLAVGEIGLDYYYEHSDRNTQRRIFAKQLTLAADRGLPVVIHTREADADTRAVLSEFAPVLERKGVIHSFTSSPELAEFCLDAGFYLGFNGIITFKNADNVRDVLAMAPVTRILLETDAPYLTPVPYRGRENAPFYLPFVAEKIAMVKDTPIDTLLETIYQSSLSLFFPDD